jgi:hypothetical protein
VSREIACREGVGKLNVSYRKMRKATCQCGESGHWTGQEGEASVSGVNMSLLYVTSDLLFCSADPVPVYGCHNSQVRHPRRIWFYLRGREGNIV